MENCYEGISIPEGIAAPCGGEYKSTDCILSPVALTYLGLPANASQTQINIAIQASLRAKDEMIDEIDGSETKLSAGSNVTITGNGTFESPYVVTATAAPLPPQELQKVLDYQIDFVNNTYTFSNADNNYTFFIQNFDEEDLLPPLNLLMPLGLETGFKVKVLKTETGIVFIDSDGIVKKPLATSPEIGKINDWVYIEQLSNTDIFYINGALGLPT